MSWRIHHVNLPTFDMERTVKFFEDVLGSSRTDFPAAQGTRATVNVDADHVARLVSADGSSEIHIASPRQDFTFQQDARIHPTIRGHIAIEVDDLDAVRARLRQLGVPFDDPGEWAYRGLSQLYVWDPFMNVIEINQRVE